MQSTPFDEDRTDHLSDNKIDHGRTLNTAPNGESTENLSIKRAFFNLPGDQKAIWTSPFHIHKQDAFWLAPLAGTTAILIGSDQHSMQRERSNADAISRSNTVANVGLIGLTAWPGMMYIWGNWRGSSVAREAGLLSGEAMADSLIVNEVLKFALGRE
ncbi:MAG: hypothetical protein ACRDRL_05440, partial [Sciscionella sp.]